MCQQWQTGPLNETACDQCEFKVIPVEELPSKLKKYTDKAENQFFKCQKLLKILFLKKKHV